MGTSDLRKAAVVLQSLSRQRAAELLGRLGPARAAAVGEEMARLGRLDRDEQAAVVREFTAAGTARPKAIDSERPQPFQFLHDTKPKELADLLAEERPQSIALVLSYLPVDQAAETLDALPTERQTSVVRRIAAMDRPNPEVIRDVETAIQRRLSGGAGSRTSGGIANVVKMLNAMRPAGERRLLGELAQVDPGLFQEIRLTMFGPDMAALGRCDAVDAA